MKEPKLEGSSMKRLVLRQMQERPRSSIMVSKSVMAMALTVALLFGAGCYGPAPKSIELEEVLAPTISVMPTLVRPGDLVSVNGTGWAADELVYISLQSTAGDIDASGLFAIANTKADGQFSISFFYPTDPSWADIASTQVEAQAVDSDLQASAALVLARGETAIRDSRSIALPVALPIEAARHC